MKKTSSDTGEVYTLKGKGVNQGVNLIKMVYTSDESNEINEFEYSDGWLTVKEAVNLLSISKVAFHKARKNGKYAKTRTVKGNGGERIEVHVECLSPGAIRKYLEAIGSLKKPTALDLANRDEAFLQRSAVSLLNRDKALNRFRVLSAYVSFLDGQGYALRSQPGL